MTLILKFVLMGIVTAIMAQLLRQIKPELVPVLLMLISAIFLALMTKHLAMAVALITDIADKAGVMPSMLGIVLKIIGVAWVAEIGAQVSRDMGEGTIATKIELAGKLMIIVMGVPIISELFDLITGMMDNFS